MNHSYSAIQRIVPYVSKPSEWYADKNNWSKCNWCKENECVKTKFGLIAWCKRCYDLHSLRHDGTYITPEFRVALAQDFDDLAKGKVEIQQQERMIKDIIQEEEPPIR